ncbi:MAG: hypothetical protein CME64_00565 [Halobacteriovoraceae bacterium]|nr:hypothetical protein [Halobacteriovoraceae bacterium]|tara:strand:- start:131753 stop:132070 length:318 start_codon:yes stop_codon:yes gene_type:complete
MKVNSSNLQAQETQKAKKRPSKEEIKARVQAKFGVEIGKPKKKEPDTVVSIDKKGEKKVSKEGFGDVKSNNPESAATQEKLRALLRTGGFAFNDKERKALNEILN